MIYTLYSFKGGVGRSMALANLAECFFRRGLKVLMIDWDLEAPGLERYFFSDPDKLAQVRARPGLIDMLREYKNRYPDLARQKAAAAPPHAVEAAKQEERERIAVDAAMTEAFERESASTNLSMEGSSPENAGTATQEDVERDAREVAEITSRFLSERSGRGSRRGRRAPPKIEASTPDPLTFGEILNQGLPPVNQYLELVESSKDAELWLLTAGARPAERFAEYADAVQDFDWLEFLAKYQGKEYLKWLRERLRDTHTLPGADVILIDSRTGVTEMGGVCTRLMGDVVVSFCAPNWQNLDGVASILSSLETEAAKQARSSRELQVLVIPTRIDDSESKLAGKFATDFDARLEVQNLPPALVPEWLRKLQKPLWDLQIPYIPKFNYREQLVIGPRSPDASPSGPNDADPVPASAPDPPTQKLIRAYENIALHLAVLAPRGSRVWDAFTSQIATQFPQLLQQKPPQTAPKVPVNWVDRPIVSGELREALFNCAKAKSGGRIAVVGLAGMGKTNLLASVCHEPDIAAAFPDGIVWQTLDAPMGDEATQDFLRGSFGIPRQGGASGLAQALEERRFLWVTDDVWTPEQLTETFKWGKRCTRVIVTRDRAIAGRFAEIVVNVGYLTEGESRAILKIPDASREMFFGDESLNWLLQWPLGASLLSAAVADHSANAKTPEEGCISLLAQLKRSGLKLLDRPGEPGRGGSISLSLRESLGRLRPGERSLLLQLALKGSCKMDAEDPELRRLRELSLATYDDGAARPHELVYRWLRAQGDLTQDAETQRKKRRTQTVLEGWNILRGKTVTSAEMRKIAEFAKDARAFTLARRLFRMLRQSPDAATLSPADKLKLIQRQALCTYKDDDLPPDERFQDALDILAEGDLQNPNPSQETLGQAGAIYKAKWRLSGQRRDLEHSLRYYGRGTEAGLFGDFGYTRINAAFVLDLLARQEEGDSPQTAQSRRQQAARLREEIAAELPGLAARPENAWLKNEWWYGATLAEALFGLKRYSDARHWLRQSIGLDSPAWQLETTCRQMAMLAFAQNVDTAEDSEAWQTLAMLVGDSSDSLRAITAGKVGLALSGGGFRASLFHIGVLARLAELDLLRHVEVLSCVSGGSIIGAHYYLEVRRLLQQKRDREVTREDYLEIVRRLERDFLAGVQKNLRAHLFAGWLANCKSLLFRGYTRTQYLGEMFERYIYSHVDDQSADKRWLNELTVKPKDEVREEETYFNPKLDNWRRAAKVPILLLNATTLNTGHVWQFAVSWMGEPPQSAGSSVDSNDVLRRMFYRDAPVRYNRIRLGHAVVSSACVPALFDPVELNGLFPRRRLHLVDGGVHDNQGIGGLLEQECSMVLVSDASGQMNSLPAPSGNILPVLTRSNSISMARVREAEFRELHTLQRSSALRGVMFLHLKKDLDLKHVDWIDCRDPYEASANPTKSLKNTTLTTYGVPKTVQALLGGLRTDLDSFSDSEAYALMLSGYRMTSTELKDGLAGLSAAQPASEPWRFLAIGPTMDRATDFEPEHDRLRQLLSIGGKPAFKAFRVRPVVSWTMLIGVLLLLGAVVVAVRQLLSPLVPANWHPFERLPALPWLHIGAPWWKLGSLLIALAILGKIQRKNVSIMLTGLVMVTVGWLIARIHLLCFDPIFRGAGTVRGPSSQTGTSV